MTTEEKRLMLELQGTDPRDLDADALSRLVRDCGAPAMSRLVRDCGAPAMSRLVRYCDADDLLRIVRDCGAPAMSRLVRYCDADDLSRLVRDCDADDLSRLVRDCDAYDLSRIKRIQSVIESAPTLEKPYTQILAAVNRDGCNLNMKTWHTCETTHCTAGWTVHLAGKEGYATEAALSTQAAADLILRKSRPGTPRPNFFASNEAAMAFIEARAREETQ